MVYRVERVRTIYPIATQYADDGSGGCVAMYQEPREKVTFCASYESARDAHQAAFWENLRARQLGTTDFFVVVED